MFERKKKKYVKYVCFLLEMSYNYISFKHIIWPTQDMKRTRTDCHGEIFLLSSNTRKINFLTITWIDKIRNEWKNFCTCFLMSFVSKVSCVCMWQCDTYLDIQFFLHAKATKEVAVKKKEVKEKTA